MSSQIYNITKSANTLNKTQIHLINTISEHLLSELRHTQKGRPSGIGLKIEQLK